VIQPSSRAGGSPHENARTSSAASESRRLEASLSAFRYRAGGRSTEYDRSSMSMRPFESGLNWWPRGRRRLDTLFSAPGSLTVGRQSPLACAARRSCIASKISPGTFARATEIRWSKGTASGLESTSSSDVQTVG
jgi:hypothetical protein